MNEVKVCGMCVHGVSFGWSRCFGLGWCDLRLKRGKPPEGGTFGVENDTVACDEFIGRAE